MAKSGSQNNPLLILLFITSLLFPELELFSVIFKFEKYIAKSQKKFLIVILSSESSMP